MAYCEGVDGSNTSRAKLCVSQTSQQWYKGRYSIRCIQSIAVLLPFRSAIPVWTGIANRPITPHDSINRAITHDRLVLSNVSSDDLSWWVTYNSSKHGFQPALTPAMYRAVFTTAMHRGPITVLVQLPGASAAKPHTPQTLATSVSSHRTARRMDCQHFVTRMAIRHNYQLGSRQ